MSLRRAGTALVASWGLTLLAGCYSSEVSLAPDADLTAVSELAPGRYCAVAPDWRGAIAVDHDDCRALAYDPERGVYVETRAWEDADWSLEHRVVRLTDGFYLTQVSEDDATDRPYTIVPFVASAEGFAAIGDVRRDGFGVFADAYRDVRVDPPGRFDSGVIRSGEPQRARALVELAARDDAAAWIAGEGDREEVVVYVRLEESEDDAMAAPRYAATVDALRARFGRLRR